MRTLVVDDSRSMRMILAKFLGEAGAQVVEARHGQEALDLLRGADPFDLMLVDWNMPVMSGYDLVRAVRANPLLAGMRIVMVTTETSLTNMEQALAAGVNEYLMKPFTPDVLRAKLALLGLE